MKATSVPEKHRWRFFDETLTQEAASSPPKTLLLSAEEAQLARVLRLKEGEFIEITNGSGLLFDGCLTKTGRKEVEVALKKVRTMQRDSCQIRLVVGKSKPSAMEDVIDSAAQLGANTISIFTSEKSPTRRALKLERLQKIAREAVRISKSAYFPQIENGPDLTLEGLIKQLPPNEPVFVCDESPLHDHSDNHTEPMGHTHLLEALQKLSSCSALSIVIGPEGGLTQAECRTLQGCGAERPAPFCFVSLGTRILTVPHAVQSAVTLARSVVNGLH